MCKYVASSARFTEFNKYEQLFMVILYRISCGGKTSLTSELEKLSEKVVVIHMDDYYQLQVKCGKYSLYEFTSYLN
jgi:uridine kinase